MVGDGAADEFDFGGDGVDGIDDVVKGVEFYGGGVFGEIEELAGVDSGMGIDGFDALSHDGYFGEADSLVGGVELTVEVAEGDGVGIDQQEVADAGAGQSLDSIGADTADAEDGDSGGGEPFDGGTAKQAFGALPGGVGRRFHEALIYRRYGGRIYGRGVGGRLVRCRLHGQSGRY